MTAPEKLTKEELKIGRIKVGPPRPKVRVGCKTNPYPHSDEEWLQYCSSCPLKDEKLIEKAFDQKCDSIRLATRAISIWTANRSSIPNTLPQSSKKFLDKMNNVEFNGDIDDYARKLNNLTTNTISEDEALEIAKAGQGKLLCNIKVVGT